MSFTKDFVWGSATASYQVEGAARQDGRGDSVWDMQCRREGKVREGHTGDVACDQYNRYREDVALLSSLNMKAYRFSLAWPRILPTGRGAINQKGMDYYKRLVEELLQHGIDPYVTIFHWDYPLDLYKQGGWLNPDSPKWFAEYTQIVMDQLSDRVSHWMTMNETQCFIGEGHASGSHAPGLNLSEEEQLICAHHTLLAEGMCAQVIRQTAKTKPIIGYAPVGNVRMPYTERAADIEAARMAMFAPMKRQVSSNALWMDPIFLGKYPEQYLQDFAKYNIPITDADMKTISEPLDFLGVNIYCGDHYRMGADGKPELVPEKIGHPQNSMHWQITPDCLYWGPKYFYERYKKPIMITENGMANNDWVALDGKVHDPQRIDYIKRHLLQLERAIEDGVDVRAYFAWSLMDNFEWAFGYTQRFGMVYVDYETQERIPKDSALWYREVARTNGAYIHE